jgi:hypothetical protein
MHPAPSRPLPHTQTLALLSRLSDLLPWPLLVLEPDATPVYANRAARELLARARLLRRDRRGRVGPARPPLRAAFQEALSRASAGVGAALQLGGRQRACQARLERLPGEGPALLLLSLSRPAGQPPDWLAAM